MSRTIPVGVAIVLVLAAFVLGSLTPDPKWTRTPAPAVTVVCTPVPDDTDAPLPAGQVACGG